MYKLCKTEQSAARQRAIENALLKKMDLVPFESITITELCEKINIPRKAFYRYFGSKEDALHGAIFHTMCDYKPYRESIADGNGTFLIDELENFFKFWIEKKKILDVLKKNNMFSILFEAAVTFPLNDFITIEKFLPKDSYNTRIRVFKFALSGLISLMVEWYEDGFIPSPREMAILAKRLLSNPLFSFPNN